MTFIQPTRAVRAPSHAVLSVLATEAEVTALLPEWDALWHRVGAASPFLSPGWLWSWWRHMGGGALRVFAVRAEDRLVALLPMFIWNDAGVRRLLPLGISVSDAFDLLAEPGFVAAAQALLGPALDDNTGRNAGWHADWDRCELHEVPADSPLLWLHGTGVRPLVQRQSTSPVLDLAAHAALKPRAAPVRKLRRARRRVEAAGTASIERIGPGASPGVIREALEQLFALHTAQWQARGQPGVLAGGKLFGFHHDVALAMAEAGALQMHRLRIDGAVVGVFHGFLRGPRAYAYAVGTDPDWSRVGPGTLLVGAAIAAAQEAGARQFDFLRGQEAYKYDWGAVDRLLMQVTLAHPPRTPVRAAAPEGTGRPRTVPANPIDSAAGSLRLASARGDAPWMG